MTITTTKTLATVTRHSRDLVAAINTVREKYPEAQEVILNGKWYVRSKDTTLAGPRDTQWEAWMMALKWDEHLEEQLGQSRTD